MTEQQHTKTVYVREDAIVPGLDTWIGGLFDDDDQGRVLELRRLLKECDVKLAKYRALLEHDSNIIIAATWIAEVEQERKNVERQLGRKPTTRKLTKNESKALVAQLRDIVAVLADADPLDKRGRLRRTRCQSHLLPRRAGACCGRGTPCTWGSCRRGDLNPHALLGH